MHRPTRTTFASVAVAGCASLALALPAFAAAASPGPAPSPTATPASLGQIVVTAQRHPTRVHDTPRETFVIDAAELDRLGATTAADALRLLPGVTINDYGTAGHVQTALLRGAGSTETLVLIDGHPANEPGVGSFDFSSLPVQAIARIEVVEGAMSTIYGSAAMGGVINIITRDAASRGGSASTTLGYEGAWSEGIDAGGAAAGVGVRLDYRAQHARQAFSYPSAFGAPAGSLANDDENGADVFGSLGADDGALHVRAHVDDNTSDVGEPGSLAFGPASTLARQQRDFLRGDVAIEEAGRTNDAVLSLYSDGQRLHYYDGTSDPANFIFPFDTMSRLTTRGLGLTDTISSASNTLVLGYDARGDRASFDEVFGGVRSSAPATASTTGLFASDEGGGRGPFVWTAGLRAERSQNFHATVVPSVGIMLRNADDDTGWRANYGRAFRIPTLEETSPFFFGNPALQPEYAATFDAGYFRGADAITYFGSRASNLIVSSPPTFVPRNVSEADIRGLNATALAPLRSGDSLRVAYTLYLRAVDLSNGDRLPFRPTATGSIQFARDGAAVRWGSELAYCGRRYANDPNTTLLPPFATLGAFVGRDIGAMSVTLHFDNITGERVEQVPGYPVMGATVSLTAAVKWR